MFGNTLLHCRIAERPDQTGLREAFPAPDTNLIDQIAIMAMPGTPLTGVDPLHHKVIGCERHFRR